MLMLTLLRLIRNFLWNIKYGFIIFLYGMIKYFDFRWIWEDMRKLLIVFLLNLLEIGLLLAPMIIQLKYMILVEWISNYSLFIHYTLSAYIA